MRNSCIIVADTDIIGMNYRNQQNFQNTINYQGADKNLHTIVLNTCLQNWKQHYPDSQHSCVGERNRERLYFLLYTSDYPTKIIFQKKS